MPPPRILVVAAAMLLTMAVDVVVGADGNTMMLTLERASHEGMGLSHLRNRDRVRHGRLLQQKLSGVVDFPLQGSWDPFLVGLYYTRVKLGTPPKEFYVQIDTGSDALWVNCNGCTGCPKSTGLEIQLQFFNPSSSSTASLISCSDQRCFVSAQTSNSGCSNEDRCGYKFRFGDGSGTSGHYVSDSIYLNKSSAQVVFGCSTSLTGDLIKGDRAVDGIFGFGQQGLSVISQLASLGITPNSFSHCLKGDNGGGGILVLGQIVEPSMVYTPLVPEMPHYNVELQSVSVKGQKLNIDPISFAASTNRGTIIDSGTTLAYLVEEAYDPLIEAITQSVPQSVSPQIYKGNQCYVTSSSISDVFPPVTLNFAGGASMTLRPKDYLLQHSSGVGDALWCIGIQKSKTGGITIIGDIILKDKVVVYDLAGQRIGWANYDCSSPVNVSTADSPGRPGKTVTVSDARQYNKNSSAKRELYMLIPSTRTAFLLYIAFFAIRPFL